MTDQSPNTSETAIGAGYSAINTRLGRPHIKITIPARPPNEITTDANKSAVAKKQGHHFPRHIQLDLSRRPERPWGSGSGFFSRSYSPSFRSTPARSRHSSGVASPAAGTPLSTVSLQQLLERLELDQYDTYGVEELRGGFFDASFFRPLESIRRENEKAALLQDGEDQQLLDDSLSHRIRRFACLLSDYITIIFRTRRGVHIAKSFLSYYLAYILCLIPRTQAWLGPHNYFAVISVLFNHSGRTLGAQVDGCIQCILGGALGVAWACLALMLSSSSLSGQTANGVMATSVVTFSLIIAWIRSSIVRIYQLVMSAGLAVYFLCLQEPSFPKWSERRIWEFAVPWLVGQAICLTVNIVIVPGAGNKEITVAFHQALMSALDALALPRAAPPELHHTINMHAVALSEAHRDMRSEITITRFNPNEVEQLRNILQAVMRDLMSIDTDTSLFDSSGPFTAESMQDDSVDGIELVLPRGRNNDWFDYRQQTSPAVELVKRVMAPPTRELIDAMIEAITVCNGALMERANHRELSISPILVDEEKLASIGSRLNSAMATFDEGDASLMDNPTLPSSYSKHPELVKLFIFIHPVRRTADSVKEMLQKVTAMSSPTPSFRVYLPTYPLRKALNRSSPQVRHDRGGMTAGYYYRCKGEIDHIMQAIADKNSKEAAESNRWPFDRNKEETTIRRQTWRVFHRLQEFESRFALKFSIVVSTLTLPGYLERHSGWYNKCEGWWAVAAAWFIMQPRVGGNAQDLVTRSAVTALGAIWGGVAYGAHSGNPYVMAVMAFIFMFPAIIRLTESSHPRSGLMACLSFSVVSLTAYNMHGQISVATIAWTRGIAIIIGICAAVVANWCLWPFVARHELRKSIAYMMHNLSISYRGIVSRYIYHDEGMEPNEEDTRLSQVLDCRLREGFFRIRELLGMTKHEIRLRGPFNATPYILLIDACEQFFEHLVKVRQASLFFKPSSLVNEPEYNRALLSVRRDAVASIIMNLNTMSGGLRNKTPIPKYLPSAAVARKRLLDRMAEIESSREAKRIRLTARPERSRRWPDVYQYAYSTALTDIVGQLERMEVIIKEIVGEMALDLPKDL